MKILESAEDYLEMILVLKKKKGTVHSIDIAREMNFSKPSVSIAMKKLREDLRSTNIAKLISHPPAEKLRKRFTNVMSLSVRF